MFRYTKPLIVAAAAVSASGAEAHYTIHSSGFIRSGFASGQTYAGFSDFKDLTGKLFELSMTVHPELLSTPQFAKAIEYNLLLDGISYLAPLPSRPLDVIEKSERSIITDENVIGFDTMYLSSGSEYYGRTNEYDYNGEDWAFHRSLSLDVNWTSADDFLDGDILTKPRAAKLLNPDPVYFDQTEDTYIYMDSMYCSYDDCSPYFVFDKNHLEASMVTTRFTVSVPEPATWLTMIIGFGTVGSAMRSRRRVAAQR